MIICDGFIYRYGGVRILQTFDTNGNVEKHIGQVLTKRNPHFRGAGDNHEHTHVCMKLTQFCLFRSTGYCQWSCIHSVICH